MALGRGWLRLLLLLLPGRGGERGVLAPAGGPFAGALVAALAADAVAGLAPAGAGRPGPAVARGVADGEEPQPGAGPEEVQQGALDAEVEGVGELLAVLLVHVLLVALAGAVALHLVVRDAASHLLLGAERGAADAAAARQGLERRGGAGRDRLILAFLGARDARERVLVQVEELLAVGWRRDAAAAVLGVVGLVHGPAERREVARLLQALDGGLALAREHDVPAGEGADDEADDARDDAEL